jgi:hypothetical protein
MEGGKMSRDLPIVDLSEHGTFDDAVSIAMNERFSMPLVVVAALRQAGKKVTLRLLEMVQDDAQFDKMTPAEKMKLAELVLDRAYGRTETASSSMKTAHQTGQTTASDHGRQLEEIEARMEEKAIKYPELRKAADARMQGNALSHNRDAAEGEQKSAMSRINDRIVQFDARKSDRVG